MTNTRQENKKKNMSEPFMSLRNEIINCRSSILHRMQAYYQKKKSKIKKNKKNEEDNSE